MGSTTVWDSGPLPTAVVRQGPLQRNIAAFQSYCDRHGVQLAPHVKTTMCERIFSEQRAAGAWGATVATIAQAKAVAAWAPRRILVANQLTDRGSLDWFVDAEREQGETELYCWVDSRQGLELLERAHERAGVRRPSRILVEVGYMGGRTGCRSQADVVEVAEQVSRSPSVELKGLCGFEGTITAESEAETHLRVDAFLGSIREATLELQRRSLLDPETTIVSAGGSAYFDRVLAALAPVRDAGGTVVLRSGCYVTHDTGVYDELSPFGSTRTGDLEAALEVWGAVLSTPERGLALAGVGKRDVSFDAGMPVVLKVRRESSQVEELASPLGVIALNDQHAYVDDPRSELRVGDSIGLGISHPCTTFDNWREIALVNDAYEVLEVMSTQF